MADRRFLDLAFRRLPLAFMAAAAGAGAACGASCSATVAWVPWVVALVVIGLAHGAADLAVSRRLCRGEALGPIWTGYAAIMATVVAAYAIAPVTVVTLFVLLSAWHFGHAHAETEMPARRRTALEEACAAAARGGITIGVPLAAQPRGAGDVAVALLGLTGHAALGDPFPPVAVRAVGLSLVTAGLVGFAFEMASVDVLPNGPRRTGDVIVELAVLALLGLVTHPLFAVGVSFLVWHAWRQMPPVAEILTGTCPDSWASLARALVRIHMAALPLLIPTWLAVGLAWWAFSGTHTLRDLAIVSIGGYLVVTPSHVLLGEMLMHPAKNQGTAPAADRLRQSPRPAWPASRRPWAWPPCRR